MCAKFFNSKLFIKNRFATAYRLKIQLKIMFSIFFYSSMNMIPVIAVHLKDKIITALLNSILIAD